MDLKTFFSRNLSIGMNKAKKLKKKKIVAALISISLKSLLFRYYDNINTDLNKNFYLQFQSEDAAGALLLLYACVLSRGCEKYVPTQFTINY